MTFAIARLLRLPFPANAAIALPFPKGANPIPIFTRPSQTAFVRFFQPPSSRGGGNNVKSGNHKPFPRTPSPSPHNAPAGPNPQAAGTKDEKIQSPVIQLVDQNGTFHGNRSTKFVLSKMNREKYFLVVVSPGGGTGKDGQEVYPTAKLVEKHAFKDKQKSQQQIAKIKSLSKMKIKEYRFSASISDGDIEHKFKSMRDTLEKGDGLRLAFTNKGTKNVTAGRKKELFDLLASRLEDIAILRNEKNEDNAKEEEQNKQTIYAVYHPKISKESIVLQRVKETKEEKQK